MGSSSNHQKGWLRDSGILGDVEKYEVLDTEQIRLLRFRGLKHGRRIALKRLHSLCGRDRLKRGPRSYDQPHYYYIGRRPGQPEHRIGVNWTRLWLGSNLKSWEVLHSFDYEVDYRVLRGDGFAAIKNTVTGAFKFYFVEFDNHLSGNPFDKVEKYNRLFEQQPVAWWTELTERFPAVIVVTTSPARAKRIREKVERANVNGLEFRVYELEQIKEACGDGA